MDTNETTKKKALPELPDLPARGHVEYAHSHRANAISLGEILRDDDLSPNAKKKEIANIEGWCNICDVEVQNLYPAYAASLRAARVEKQNKNVTPPIPFESSQNLLAQQVAEKRRIAFNPKDGEQITTTEGPKQGSIKTHSPFPLLGSDD